ncbi:MAG: hypothetical protein ACYCTL_12435 [Acidimicrobiales bacterium]
MNGTEHLTTRLTKPLEPALAAKVRPTSPSQSHLLDVPAPLAPLLPGGGLRRGMTVVVESTSGSGGTASLATALMAVVTASGIWCSAVGDAASHPLAAVGMGVNLDRLALVPRPGPRWAEAVYTLLDGMAIVAVRPPAPPSQMVTRRLSSRAREQRAVLLLLPPGSSPPEPESTMAGKRLAPGSPWPDAPDLRLAISAGIWETSGDTSGYLGGRRVEVIAIGRRQATKPVRIPLWLPDSSGAVIPA